VLFLEFEKETFETMENYRFSSLLVKLCFSLCSIFRCPYLKIK